MPEHTYEIFVGVKGDAKRGGVYRYDYDEIGRAHV